eukprot:Sdes_comp8597_c0_seq1m109
MGSRNIIIEDSPFKRNARKSSPALYFLITNFSSLFLIFLALYPILISIIAPIVWVELSKAIAQNSLDGTSVEFTNIQLGPANILLTHGQSSPYLSLKADMHTVLAGASQVTINPSKLQIMDGRLVGKDQNRLMDP